jgi:hypothetical protein
MFRKRSLYLVPSAVIAGQKRAERHARRRRKRIEGHRRYNMRRRIRYASGNLIAQRGVFRGSTPWAGEASKSLKLRCGFG